MTSPKINGKTTACMTIIRDRMIVKQEKAKEMKRFD